MKDSALHLFVRGLLSFPPLYNYYQAPNKCPPLPLVFFQKIFQLPRSY